MSDKIYVGSGKKVGQYNDVNYALCLSDIPKEWIYEYKGKKYVNITGKEKQKVDEYGKSHYMTINTWKPDNNNSGSVQEETNDLPF